MSLNRRPVSLQTIRPAVPNEPYERTTGEDDEVVESGPGWERRTRVIGNSEWVHTPEGMIPQYAHEQRQREERNLVKVPPGSYSPITNRTPRRFR